MNPSKTYLTRCQPSAVECWFWSLPRSDFISHTGKESKGPDSKKFCVNNTYSFPLVKTAALCGCGRQITAQLLRASPCASSALRSQASIRKRTEHNVYTDTDLHKQSHTHTFMSMAYAQTKKWKICVGKVINWSLLNVYLFLLISALCSLLMSALSDCLIKQSKFNSWQF